MTGEAVYPHILLRWLTGKHMAVSSSLLPRVPLFPPHVYSKNMCQTPIRGQSQCSAPIPFRSVFDPSICPCLSLSVSTPSVCSLSPTLLSVLLVCQILAPTHHPLGLLSPKCQTHLHTLVSCPFPCFRGTCLDSGPLGGKRGEKRGLRPCWVGEKGQKQLEVAKAFLHEPALM